MKKLQGIIKNHQNVQKAPVYEPPKDQKSHPSEPYPSTTKITNVRTTCTEF